MISLLRNFTIFIILISGSISVAQTYPEVILPGHSKTVQTGSDTLWILKDSQLKKAITAAKMLKIEEDISKELRSEISVMQQKDIAKDSLISIYLKDRDFYIDNWKICTNDVDQLIKKQKRQKFYTRLSLLGIVAAFVTGFFIGK
jgi:hypothetical protein